MQTNVVQFPKKYVGIAPKVTNFDAMKLNKELQFADELTDGIMVSMIHNMDENGIEITEGGFIQDIAFLSEALKSRKEYSQLNIFHLNSLQQK